MDELSDISAEQLKEHLAQRWKLNYYTLVYSDQFGFTIHSKGMFYLRYRNEPIVALHSLAAAQLISSIIMNDIILNKPLNPDTI